jgi:heparosan-N-sulfate-glucuronate 5-epimerase
VVKKLRCGEVPMTIVDTGEQIYFPIAVFQYGLGAYDLYLLNKGRKNA